MLFLPLLAGCRQTTKKEIDGLNSVFNTEIVRHFKKDLMKKYDIKAKMLNYVINGLFLDSIQTLDPQKSVSRRVAVGLLHSEVQKFTADDVVWCGCTVDKVTREHKEAASVLEKQLSILKDTLPDTISVGDIKNLIIEKRKSMLDEFDGRKDLWRYCWGLTVTHLSGSDDRLKRALGTGLLTRNSYHDFVCLCLVNGMNVVMIEEFISEVMQDISDEIMRRMEIMMHGLSNYKN